MSLTAGTNVVVADNEVVTAGSGLKLELYNAELATITLTPLYTVGQTSSPFSADAPATEGQVADANPQLQAMRVSTLRGIAARANAYGAAIVAHIVANGKAVVGTSTSCGRTPDPLAAATAILGPAVELELSIR